MTKLEMDIVTYLEDCSPNKDICYLEMAQHIISLVRDSDTKNNPNYNPDKIPQKFWED
jgi:hypothetical protein